MCTSYLHKLKMIFATKDQSETASLLSQTRAWLHTSDSPNGQIALKWKPFYGVGHIECGNDL